MKLLRLLLMCFVCNVHADLKSDARAIDHAPMGVSGDHYHKKGESMISVRHGHMAMGEALFKGETISLSDVLAMPNPQKDSPVNLSVIPTDMTMKMTMIGGMYAPTDRVTLMIMGMFVAKEMQLTTYQPMMNRDLVGRFSTSSSDVSDISLGALITLKESQGSRLHGEIALQHSIGSNDAKGVVLTPMGEDMNMILPYGMQAGDSASRLVLGMTHVRDLIDNIKWGNQVRTKIAVSQGEWSFGDHTEVNSWLQCAFSQSGAISARLKWTHQNKIWGRNPAINGPVQTANPENYGGVEWHIGLGINWLTRVFSQNVDRVGLELLLPIKQEKNNLQLATKYQLTLGYQKAF